MAKANIAVMSVTASAVDKYQDFDTLGEAQAHVAAFIGTFPDAYAVANPGGASRDWVADMGLETLTHDATLAVADAKVARKSEADALCATKSNADFTHGGKTFDAGTRAQGTISFAIAYAQLNAIADATTRNWTLADNTTVSVTWGAVRAMATTLFERNDAYHATLQTHKNAIDALGTVEAIESYNITTGW